MAACLPGIRQSGLACRSQAGWQKAVGKLMTGRFRDLTVYKKAFVLAMAIFGITDFNCHLPIANFNSCKNSVNR
ncbi:hypothetical protein GWN91_06080 [Candidatus Saccharibacteria bacterium]|nr:hypothetical protein [Candidatus Saccharibacteria bacterium]NIV04246.1 hypothetical protein [Calditrichia bacterium]